MGEVSVEYIVSDVGRAVRFYTGMLGFHVDMQPAGLRTHFQGRSSALAQ